jgi:hypothetical protein
MKTLAFAAMLIPFAGCRTPDAGLSPDHSPEVQAHVDRIRGFKPDLDPEESRLLGTWMTAFLKAQLHWEGPSLLEALQPCTSVEGYIQALERACGLSWAGLIERAFITWESQVKGGEDPSVLHAQSEFFHLVTQKDSGPAREVEFLADVALEAWNEAVKVLHIQGQEVDPRYRLVWYVSGQWVGTQSRVPIFLLPNRTAWTDMAPPGMAEGSTRVNIRLRDPAPYPRLLGEVDPWIQCGVIYRNPLSLITLAHEVVHIVAFLAFTDWKRLRPDERLEARADLDRLMKESIPPFVLDKFVAEGVANAIAARVPRVSRVLLLEDWLKALRQQARTNGVPEFAELVQEPHSPWTASFFTYLIENFGGDKLRTLMTAKDGNFDEACRSVFGENREDLVKQWEKSLVE